MNAVCCHVHIWATLSGCRPCIQLEMPDESESVLWRLRSPRQLSLRQTSSGCAPSQSSPFTFIRDSINVKPSDCALIHSVILSLFLSKHSYILSQLQGFNTDPLVCMAPFSLLSPFSYSPLPCWWMSSLDATLTCICPLCLPLSCTPFSLSFLSSLWALYTWDVVKRFEAQDRTWLLPKPHFNAGLTLPIPVSCALYKNIALPSAEIKIGSDYKPRYQLHFPSKCSWQNKFVVYNKHNFEAIRGSRKVPGKLNKLCELCISLWHKKRILVIIFHLRPDNLCVLVLETTLSGYTTDGCHLVSSTLKGIFCSL